jgi:hypothetical protein
VEGLCVDVSRLCMNVSEEEAHAASTDESVSGGGNTDEL